MGLGYMGGFQAMMVKRWWVQEEGNPRGARVFDSQQKKEADSFKRRMESATKRRWVIFDKDYEVRGRRD